MAILKHKKVSFMILYTNLILFTWKFLEFSPGTQGGKKCLEKNPHPVLKMDNSLG